MKINKNENFWIDFTSYPAEINEAIRECDFKIETESKDFLKRTKFILKKYPEIPELHFLLAKAYYKKQVFDNFFEIADSLYRKYPDYLLAKLTQSLALLKNNNTIKFLRIFTDFDDISKFAPTRKEFNEEELILYYYICANYFLLKENDEKALELLGKMQDIDEYHTFTQQLADQTEEINDKFDYDEFDGESGFFKDDFYVNNTDCYEKDIQTDEKPVFVHQEINELYETDYHIDEEIINKIIELPRESLIKDLETVLIDSIKRFEFFRNKYELDEIEKHELFFPIHACILLVELDAKPSFKVIERVINQGEELIYFWYEEDVALYTVFYQFFRDNIGKLYELITVEGMHFKIREIVITTYRNIAIRHPEKLEEITSYIKKFINHLKTNQQNNKIFDYVLNERIVETIIELKISELSSEIKYFYDNDFFTDDYVEDFYDFEEFYDHLNYNEFNDDDEIPPMYTNITEEYKDYKIMLDDSLEGFFSNDIFNDKEFSLDPDNHDCYSDNGGFELKEDDMQPIKVGRNAPCPCGSGKKYKKCCMNK